MGVSDERLGSYAYAVGASVEVMIVEEVVMCVVMWSLMMERGS
jgi:hypothetical protein